MSHWDLIIEAFSPTRVPILLDGLFSAATLSLTIQQQLFTTALFKSTSWFDVLNPLIHEEIIHTAQTNTLLRLNTVVPKLIGMSFRTLGNSFLNEFLTEIIDKISKDKSPSLEIFPTKASDEETAYNNLRVLLDYAQSIVDYVCSHLDRIPLQLRYIMKMLSDEIAVSENLKEMKYSCVGSVFFLRFICPIIATPVTWIL